MKNLFLLLIFLLSSTAQAWQVIVVNVSKAYDMQVNYHICSGSFNDPQRICSNDESILIKNSSKPSDINYISIKHTDNMPSPNAMLEIISAIEKDKNGNVQAKGQFTNNTTYNYCGGLLAFNPNTLDENIFVLLDDMNGTPFISCRTTSLSYL